MAATELADRIRKLESELQKLRIEQLKLHRVDIPPKPQELKITLDLKLQKQVLMLTEAMPHMVFISDSEGRTTHANDRFYEFSGMPRSADDGWAWVNVLHPEDFTRSIEEGNKAALVNKPFSMELRCRNGKGEYCWQLMHSMPFFDPDTNSTKWFGTSVDIHEQKNAQEKLAESEAQFRTLADAIPHIVYATNPDGSIFFWNHRFFEYSGFTVEQGLSEGWSLLIHSQDRNGYLSDWKKALRSGDTFEFEFRLQRAVGINNSPSPGYLWHLARAVAMRDGEGQIIRWFGTWTEIEGQKRANGD